METKYTKEFKSEAIRLGEREGVSADSEKLGIGAKTFFMHGGQASSTAGA